MFHQVVADTKYLQDIPHYLPQMQRLGLPLLQYTGREAVSGLYFAGYADELSKSYAVLLAKQLCAHLARHGVELRQLEWQTDNRAESLQDAHQRGLPGTVRAFGSGHHYIPPKAYTWQSDVETVHRLVEDEFFDRERFGSAQEFWAKVTTHWWYCNLARPNHGKSWLTPMEILRVRDPNLNLPIAAWHPLDLCALQPQSTSPNKGHDLPNGSQKFYKKLLTNKGAVILIVQNVNREAGVWATGFEVVLGEMSRSCGWTRPNEPWCT